MKNGSYHCKERRVFCRIFIFVLKELYFYSCKNITKLIYKTWSCQIINYQQKLIKFLAIRYEGLHQIIAALIKFFSSFFQTSLCLSIQTDKKGCSFFRIPRFTRFLSLKNNIKKSFCKIWEISYEGLRRPLL